MTSFSRVTVLVDWDTARRLIRWPPDVKSKHIEAVFEKLQAAIAHYLDQIDRNALFRVNWRVYHAGIEARLRHMIDASLINLR
jgi:hypothetical protein